MKTSIHYITNVKVFDYKCPFCKSNHILFRGSTDNGRDYECQTCFRKFSTKQYSKGVYTL